LSYRLVHYNGGKLEADALFWALAIGFLSGNYRTLEEFRQEYIDTFGGSLSYASFHDWFMPALCEFLREALNHENERLQGRFEQFREVFIADMTVITLYQSIQPHTGSNVNSVGRSRPPSESRDRDSARESLQQRI
jgi:hypothetical protein